jgi:hypothetical protein
MILIPGLRRVLPLVLLGALAVAAPAAGASSVAGLVARDDEAGLRAIGPQVMPEILRLYEAGDAAQRARIANLFYRLSWKSPQAARVLLRDAHTNDPWLRVAVQYALGRLSNDPAVLDTLIDTMQHDENPHFRDKAACALAYDQIHLTESQKVKLYEGLIEGLASEERQVRGISIQALRVLTGQTKGYVPGMPPERRRKAIETWTRWLAEYKENL